MNDARKDKVIIKFYVSVPVSDLMLLEFHFYEHSLYYYRKFRHRKMIQVVDLHFDLMLLHVT